MFSSKWLFLCSLALCLFASSTVLSATSNIQGSGLLEEIKNMPSGQRIDLARRYGIDLSSLKKDSSRQKNILERSEQVLMQRTRGGEGTANSSKDENLEKIDISQLKDEEIIGRFGAQIFDSSIVSFSPLNGMMVPDNYILGPGDTINLTVLGSEPIDDEIEIGRDGVIVIPSLGAINIAGLDFERAREKIRDQIAQKTIANEVYVSMGRLKRINILVLGDIEVPGSYSVSSFTNILHALYLSGGISELGSYRNIEVRRQGKLITSMDLYDLLLRGIDSSSYTLRDGDVVFIPIKKKEVIAGKGFKRTKRFELRENESLEDFVNMSGGFTSSANRKMITIARKDSRLGARISLNVNLAEKPLSKVVLEDGDLIEALLVNDETLGSVELTGALVNPGFVGWEPGSRITSFINSLSKDLKKTAELSVSLVVRRNQIDRTIEKIIPFNIVKALAEKTPDNDVLLQPLDQVIILPKVSKEFLSKYRRVKYLSDALVDSRGGLNQELQDSIEDFVSGEAEEHIVFVTSDLSKIRESNFEFPEGKKDDDHEENPFTTRINLANKFEILRYLQDKKLFLNERRSLLQPIVQELQDQNSNGEMSQLVEILGAVADPGVYPILDPSGLDNLVTLAGGLLEGGNFGQMELVRTTFNKGNVLKRIIKLDVSDLGDREILKIENGDVFRIGYATNWRPPEKVEVSGEVMNPGVYQLKIGERLSSVLERAGGVNGNGDLEGLVYNSTKALAKQRLQMKALLDASSRGKAYEPQHVVGSDPESPTQIKPVIVEFHESILDNLSGRVVVDVQSMLEGNRGADPILSDGDRVFVPTSSSEVLVTGEVYQPGNYSYQEGSFIFDYLKDAGGPTELANGGGTFAILPNGSVLKLGKSRFRKRIFEFDSAGSSIPAGSVVVVPPKYYHERTLDKWAVISRVASQSLTSLALPFAIIKSSSDD